MQRKQFRRLFPTYVISLERTPDRLQRFVDMNRDADIDVEVFKAFDGRGLDLAGVDPAVLVPGTTSYRPGSIGSAISHRTLWQACAAGDKPFLIFEDDAAIRADTRDVLPDLVGDLDKSWDLLILGCNTDFISEVALADDLHLRFGFTVERPDATQLRKFTTGRHRIGVVRLIHFFGLCGYLLSPSGAQSLLRQCFPLDARAVHFSRRKESVQAYTLDTRINAHLRFINAFACLPPLVMPDNTPAHSAKV